MRALDTSAGAIAVFDRRWRDLPPGRKLALVQAWSADLRTLAEAGVRCRHPEMDPVAVQIEAARVLYGADVIDDRVEQAVRARR